jgi:hypothetical protein
MMLLLRSLSLHLHTEASGLGQLKHPRHYNGVSGKETTRCSHMLVSRGASHLRCLELLELFNGHVVVRGGLLFGLQQPSRTQRV